MRSEVCRHLEWSLCLRLRLRLCLGLCLGLRLRLRLCLRLDLRWLGQIRWRQLHTLDALPRSRCLGKLGRALLCDGSISLALTSLLRHYEFHLLRGRNRRRLRTRYSTLRLGGLWLRLGLARLSCDSESILLRALRFILICHLNTSSLFPLDSLFDIDRMGPSLRLKPNRGPVGRSDKNALQ